MGKVSEIFMDAFSDGGGSIVLTCVCGRTHFDIYNTHDYDEGEFAELQKKQTKEPDKYISSDGSVSYYNVDGLNIVYGCPCATAVKYEKFIRDYRWQIVKFLKALSEELLEDSKKTNPSP